MTAVADWMLNAEVSSELFQTVNYFAFFPRKVKMRKGTNESLVASVATRLDLRPDVETIENRRTVQLSRKVIRILGNDLLLRRI